MTKQDFYEGLKTLRKLSPDSYLLSLCEAGYSRLTQAYMRKALAMLPDEDVIQEHSTTGDILKERKTKALDRALKKSAQIKVEKSSAIMSDKPIPAEVDNLYKKLRNLAAQRSKLSNAFHTLGTDADRAKNSHKIRAIQRQITGIYIQLRAYHEKGVVPEDMNELVPRAHEMTDFELTKKRNSIRARISQLKRWKKQVMGVMARNDDDEKTLSRIEFQLERKRQEIEYVESLITRG